MDRSDGARGGGHGETPTSNDSVRLAALELVTISCVPAAVAALARLNVFEALARAGDGAQLTAPELAALAMPGKSINVAYLGRLLRMMSGKQILRESVTISPDGTATERRYALEPIARFLVDDPDNGSFLYYLFMLQSSSSLDSLQRLDESVVDDSMNPFQRAHGMKSWEHFQQNPELDAVFNKAMAGYSAIYMPAVLDAYRGFDDVKVLVDVGGGFGSSLGRITARYPHIRGINFDQPHVIDACPQIPRVEHVGGNMFESVPNGGDAIFMKYILHDWDDESCLKILKNCYQALPAHGKVIALDNMLPEIISFGGGDAVALNSDIRMMNFFELGARERTEVELRKLGLAAGFRQVKVICKVDLIAVTEFYK